MINIKSPSPQQMVLSSVLSLKLPGKDTDLVLNGALQSLHHFRAEINSMRTTCSAACEGRPWFHPLPHSASVWQDTGTISQAFLSHRVGYITQ